MPILSNETIAQLPRARAELYRCIGLGFRYPDQAIQCQLRSHALNAQLRAAAQIIEMAEGVSMRAAVEEGWQRLTQPSADALCTTFIRTFGHTAQSSIPLYETEYGDAHTLRGLHELGDIAGCYRAFGLEVAHGLGERVDHVAIECAFMHVLCYKEAYAAVHHGKEQRTICRDAQVRFVREHLGWWMPSMLRRVIDAQCNAYTSWAHWGLLFLQHEHERLGVPQASERLGLRMPDLSLEGGCTSCAAETSCPGGTDAMAV